jgi:hypothetical protein
MATRCSTIKLTQKTMQNLSKRGSASMSKASDMSQSRPSSPLTMPESLWDDLNRGNVWEATSKCPR